MSELATHALLNDDTMVELACINAVRRMMSSFSPIYERVLIDDLFLSRIPCLLLMN